MAPSCGPRCWIDKCCTCATCPWKWVKSEPLLPGSPGTPDRRPRFWSEADPEVRVTLMTEAGASVLNRGLGALRTKHTRQPNSPWFSPAACLVVLGVGVTAPCAVLIEVVHAKSTEESFFKQDEASRSAGLIRLAAIPLSCSVINFIIFHIRQTTFWWQKKENVSCCGFDPLARWPVAIALLGLMRSACLEAINPLIAGHISFYIEVLLYLICLGLYYALLDRINDIIKGMAEEQEVINKTAPVSKMQKLVRDVSRSGRADRDAVYCFDQSNIVPAEVLSYVWWLYYIVGKILGAALVLATFLGVSNSVVTHAFIGGFALSAATASGFMFELGPNTLSLIRISLNKPFYVGDLVTLNTNGAMDAPAVSIMGFVENITMMYVVVRNFEMKQTWIPHKAFSGMIIQNWTRRPSKTVLLNIGVSCRCPVKKVEQLTAFGKRWIQASHEIQQTNYQKCHITKTANGYNIEVIFFPAIGVSHRGIRQKFLIAFMAAAERMEIPFVPLQIMQNFCDNSATAPSGISKYVMEDASLDDLLPDPNDKLPKGVGLGFRNFPGSRPDLQGRPGDKNSEPRTVNLMDLFPSRQGSKEKADTPGLATAV